MKVDDKDPYNKKGKKSKISEKEKYYGCLSFNHHQTTRPRSNLVAYIVDLWTKHNVTFKRAIIKDHLLPPVCSSKKINE